MRRENIRRVVINLAFEPRDDGRIMVSSTDIPLFHLLIDSEDDFDTVVLPILKETMERNLGVTDISLSRADRLDEFIPEAMRPKVPLANVIVELPT